MYRYQNRRSSCTSVAEAQPQKRHSQPVIESQISQWSENIRNMFSCINHKKMWHHKVIPQYLHQHGQDKAGNTIFARRCGSLDPHSLLEENLVQPHYETFQLRPPIDSAAPQLVVYLIETSTVLT